jgi:hypothetical protein
MLAVRISAISDANTCCLQCFTAPGEDEEAEAIVKLRHEPRRGGSGPRRVPADRQPSAADRQSSTADRQSSAADKQPSSINDRDSSATDRRSYNTDRQSSTGSSVSKRQKIVGTLEDAFPTALSTDDLIR